MISLLPTIDSSAQLGWSCAGNFVVVINSNEKASQPEVTAGASETHTLPTHYTAEQAAQSKTTCEGFTGVV